MQILASAHWMSISGNDNDNENGNDNDNDNGHDNDKNKNNKNKNNSNERILKSIIYHMEVLMLFAILSHKNPNLKALN